MCVHLLFVVFYRLRIDDKHREDAYYYYFVFTICGSYTYVVVYISKQVFGYVQLYIPVYKKHALQTTPT
jgi:hypothetical protein